MSGRRDVYCVIDDEFRSLKTANSVAEGRFTHGGETVQLSLPPDWFSLELPTDEEWRIEWSKFYFGLDLAHARQVTGSDVYFDVWRALVESWIDQVPAEHDSADVTARRVQNWVYAWQRFEAAEGFGVVPVDLEQQLLTSIAAQTDHLVRNLSAERNHRTLELYALFLVGLALPEADPADDLVDFAAHELYRNVCLDILPDGVHRELSTHYHAIVLRSLVGLLVNAQRFGVDLPRDLPYRVERAADFLASVIRPDGTLPRLSDSDDGDYRGLLSTAAALFGREDLRYIASGGRQGRAPERTTAEFPDGGYVVQRSGWGDGGAPFAAERHLVFDCGAIGASGHGHYDALHIEVYGAGRPLLVDPGRYTYNEAGPVNWRRTFKSTAAHNTVTVDALDQSPYHRGKNKGATSHTRRLPVRDSERSRRCAAEVVSPNYDAIHRREIRFVSNEWWLVIDSLTGLVRHRYDLRFHLHPEAINDITAEGTSVVRAPGLALLACRPASLSLEPGWVAPEYGRRVPAPVVSFVIEDTTALFLTAVIPVAQGDATPEVLATNDDVVEVARGPRVDRVRWRDAFSWGRS